MGTSNQLADGVRKADDDRGTQAKGFGVAGHLKQVFRLIWWRIQVEPLAVVEKITVVILFC